MIVMRWRWIFCLLRPFLGLRWLLRCCTGWAFLLLKPPLGFIAFSCVGGGSSRCLYLCLFLFLAFIGFSCVAAGKLFGCFGHSLALIHSMCVGGWPSSRLGPPRCATVCLTGGDGDDGGFRECSIAGGADFGM